MSVIDIDTLLAPVSAEAPCGPNLDFELPYRELVALARGKPEQVIGDIVKPAEEPEWAEVRERAEALFASTKDLQVASILHLALLKTAGIEGFEAGLCLQRRLLEQYWEHLHPQLDPEEDNDPIDRVNWLLEAVAGDNVVATLRTSPLVESRQFGRHSLRSVRIAKGILKVSSPDGQPIDLQQELSRIEAAFADAPLERLSDTAAVLASAVDHLKAIEQILMEQAGGVPDGVKASVTDLREMKALLDAQVAKRSPASTPHSADDLLDVMSPGANTAAAVAPSGAIRNRSDVVLMIDKICEYYARTEPASPVPFVLQRAKRLASMNFMEILRDMTPSGVSEAEIIVGPEQ